MRFIPVLFPVIMVVTFSILAQNGSSNEAYLSPGWDMTGPLDWGKVSWEDQSDGFYVTFELRRALPYHNYTVGAHFFRPGNFTDYPNVTEFLGWFVDNATITREGQTAATEAWDFGYLVAGKNGYGIANFKGYVPAGTYYAQFTVREGSGCRPLDGETNGCEVVYRTGNKFADGLEKIVIREKEVDKSNPLKMFGMEEIGLSECASREGDD